jgi:DNA-binding response OmpR family regulator
MAKTSDPMQVLVVDDEARIRTMLRRYLTDEGFKVAEADGGPAARAALDHGAFDVILLDLMMPGEDGISLARFIRQRVATPIIMLTGKGDVIDRVAGLEAGADDYVTKPFHLREILARIRTVMRRGAPRDEAAPTATTSPLAAAERPGADGQLNFQNWRLDLMKRELYDPRGARIPLTTGEFELLSVFARHPNRVLNRDQLMELSKGREWAAYDRAIDTQVGRLRKKIEVDPNNPTLIKTVRGAGYIFAP